MLLADAAPATIARRRETSRIRLKSAVGQGNTSEYTWSNAATSSSLLNAAISVKVSAYAVSVLPTAAVLVFCRQPPRPRFSQSSRRTLQCFEMILLAPVFDPGEAPPAIPSDAAATRILLHGRAQYRSPDNPVCLPISLTFVQARSRHNTSMPIISFIL